MSFLQICLLLAKGAGYTVLVTAACIATALVTGLAIAILRRQAGAALTRLLAIYVYVFRGVPVLVLLFIMFFGLPGIGMNVPPLVSMMLSLGLISGAYLAEVFRGALEAIDPHEVIARRILNHPAVRQGMPVHFLKVPPVAGGNQHIC